MKTLTAQRTVSAYQDLQLPGELDGPNRQGGDPIPACHICATPAPRVFVSTPYHPGPDGRMVPAPPDVAPCNGQDGKRCRLFSDHDRPRKTGPRFPLQVMRCGAHGIAFTLYPRGHVPYGRDRIAPVAADGSPSYGTADTHRFAGTWFDAALQAAAGEAWPQDFQDDHPSAIPRFGTQLTRLARACLLTGVAPGLSEEHRAACAQALAIPGQLLHEATQRLRDDLGYPSQGRAVREVLDHLAMAPSLFERLARCGTAAGLWPLLHQWQPAVGLLQPSAFPWPGTRAPPPTIGAKARPQKP